MLKSLMGLTALCTVMAASISAAQASDPCAGYDVACDSDGCLICWEGSSPGVDLVCEEASLVEVQVTLPGCVGAQRGLDLVTPQGPRGPVLIDHGGRTMLPQTPAPQRDPATPRQ